MIGATYTALKARIESGTGLSGKVFDAARVTNDGELIRDLYLILFPSAPDDVEAGRYMAVADWDSMTAVFDYRLRFVGRSLDEVHLLMDRALPLLTGHRVVVAGRRNDPIKPRAIGEVRPDYAVRPPLFTGDVGLRFISRPGPDHS